jgi:hypothetical protein
MDENSLRRLAEEVRANLRDLISDEQQRAQVDHELLEALQRPSGSAAAALRDALRSHEAIVDWLAIDVDRAVDQIGDVTEPLGVLFICPTNDYSIVLETAADEAPLCPRCGSVLDRVQG